MVSLVAFSFMCKEHDPIKLQVCRFLVGVASWLPFVVVRVVCIKCAVRTSKCLVIPLDKHDTFKDSLTTLHLKV